MLFGEKIRRAIRSITGLSVYKKLPTGVDALEDLIFYLGRNHFKTFFDVGANIGNAAKEMRRNFPNAEIYCFEPNSENFNLLIKNSIKGDFKCWKLGLGNRNSVEFIGNPMDNLDPTMWTFSKENQMVSGEEVEIQTIDHFCEKHGIISIDYLKTDTEGYEKEVLEGASKLLEEGRIKVINVEMGMNYKNTYHNSSQEIQAILESYDYVLFGIYDQIHDWRLSKPYLRVSNGVFVNAKYF